MSNWERAAELTFVAVSGGQGPCVQSRAQPVAERGALGTCQQTQPEPSWRLKIPSCRPRYTPDSQLFLMKDPRGTGEIYQVTPSQLTHKLSNLLHFISKYPVTLLRKEGKVTNLLGSSWRPLFSSEMLTTPNPYLHLRDSVPCWYPSPEPTEASSIRH